MNLLVIGGSNSKVSINRKLAQFAASLFENGNQDLVDYGQMDLPLYSIDKEMEIGIPDLVLDFANRIDTTDMIILSLAENNGSFNVGFKNLIDWTSRIRDRKIFAGKSIFLLSTSPGPRGGATVLETALKLIPYWGGVVKDNFSLPSFYQHFKDENGIIDETQLNILKTKIKQLNS